MWWCNLPFGAGTKDDQSRVQLDDISCNEHIAINEVAELLWEGKKAKRKIVCRSHDAWKTGGREVVVWSGCENW